MRFFFLRGNLIFQPFKEMRKRIYISDLSLNIIKKEYFYFYLFIFYFVLFFSPYNFPYAPLRSPKKLFGTMDDGII